MNREKVCRDIIKLPNNYILAELPTGFGKSKIALEVVKDRIINKSVNKILIVIPRLVLINNWKEEIDKWGCSKYLSMFEFVTYVSLPKKLAEPDIIWDLIIFDEAHHLSLRCRKAIEDTVICNSILLSATIKKEVKEELKMLFPNLYVYKVTTKQAIKSDILPDPTVLLIPLTLNYKDVDFEIIKNKNQKVALTISYADRWKYSNIKNRKLIIKCTQRQYYEDMSSTIEWYKKRKHIISFKNIFLRRSGERLKWLSNQKTEFIKHLLNYLQNQRTLVFCNSIAQTEELGKYCINSKNQQSESYLQDFNDEKIDHITACNMLDEGINLSNCKIGIYATLNSSERIIKQKLGRLLRHPEPIIIIPYYKGTRDEEIVNTMLEDYNPELVNYIDYFKEIEEYVN